jgi:hypothetical protein
MKAMTRAGMLGIGLLTLAAGCTSQQESRRAASEWIGKDRTELAKVMGQPHQAVPMTDTGGEMLFYGYEGHRYIFEISPAGVVTSAVQTD